MRLLLHAGAICLVLLLCTEGAFGVTNAMIMCTDSGHGPCLDLGAAASNFGFSSITAYHAGTGPPTAMDVDDADVVFFAFSGSDSECDSGTFDAATQALFTGGNYMVYVDGMGDDCRTAILAWLDTVATATVAAAPLTGGTPACSSDAAAATDIDCLFNNPNTLNAGDIPMLCADYTAINAPATGAYFFDTAPSDSLIAYFLASSGDRILVVGSEDFSFGTVTHRRLYENMATFLLFDCCDDSQNAPVLTIPSDPQTLNTDPGQCCAAASYTATVSDADAPPCPDPTITSVTGPADGACMVDGDTVTVEAQDSVQTVTGSWTYQIVDNEGPTFTCPDSEPVGPAIGQCQMLLSSPDPADLADNCDAVGDITYTLSPNTINDGSTMFPVDPNPVSITATAEDQAGNTSTCTFELTVIDNQAPLITCNGNAFGTTDMDTCVSTTVMYPMPTASDNCGLVPGFVYNPAEFSQLNVGVTDVQAIVEDVNGIRATCAFTATVTDGQAPNVSCADTSSDADPGQCFSSTITYSDPMESDNCTPNANLIITHTIPEGNNFAVGTTSVTRDVRDEAGLISECSFDVTVTDNQGPGITCPGDQVSDYDPGLCTASNLPMPEPLKTDNCPGSVTHAESPPASGSYGPGPQTFTYTATDIGGNTATCTFEYSFVDNEPPTFTSCPADYSVPIDTQFNYVVTAADNCDPSPTLSQVSGVEPTDSSPVAGSFTVVWQVVDNRGFTTQCQFVITVLQAVLQPVEDQYLMMYLPVTVETSPSVVYPAADSFVHWELRQLGGGATVYQSEEVAIASTFTTLGPRKLEPGTYEFWIATDGSTVIRGPDLFLCSSPYVDFPAGCHIS